MEVRHGIARVDEGIEQGAIGLSQRLIQDEDGIFQLGQGARANDGRGYARLVFDSQQG